MATVHFNKESFQKEVLDKKGIALVDFWATWCGPCRMLGPVIDELANELEGSVLVGQVNVDEEEELARQYRVMSIPTVYIFKDGEAVNRIIGAVPKEKILEALNEVKQQAYLKGPAVTGSFFSCEALGIEKPQTGF